MSTPFPLNHSTQIAEKSIEDAFNRQTYLGNSFILGSGSLSLADTSEHPELLLTNASTSGKSLFIIGRRISSTAPCFLKMYVGPTVSGNGTPATPSNLRPAYNTASVVSAFTAPSISGNGTLVSTIGASLFESNLLYVLDPGKIALFNVASTSGSGGSPTTAYIEINWYEL